ncbi:hypothetical protein HDU97_004422 [Phlyctochytrium planicorne]|nr:hypothetical protein HDU97_004422 [Phlyctochytrium planicorne]
MELPPAAPSSLFDNTLPSAKSLHTAHLQDDVNSFTAAEEESTNPIHHPHQTNILASLLATTQPAHQPTANPRKRKAVSHAFLHLLVNKNLLLDSLNPLTYSPRSKDHAPPHIPSSNNLHSPPHSHRKRNQALKTLTEKPDIEYSLVRIRHFVKQVKDLNAWLDKEWIAEKTKKGTDTDTEMGIKSIEDEFEVLEKKIKEMALL